MIPERRFSGPHVLEPNAQDAAAPGNAASRGAPPSGPDRPATPPSPLEVRAWFEEARLAADLQQPRAALLLARRCVEAEPDHPEYRSLLGYCLARTGTDLDRAWETCRAALDDRPEDARLHYHLAYVAERRGDHDTARTHYEAAVRRAPDDVHLRRALEAVPGKAASRRPWKLGYRLLKSLWARIQSA